MKNCEQTKGQSVFQHGISVYKKFLDLKTSKKESWKLPDWYDEDILNRCYDQSVLKQYMIWHDCGKPFCLVEDDKGRHFPDHANKSYETYLEYFDDIRVAELIRDDMMLHTCTSDQLATKLTEWSSEHAFSLLVAALCELHSNADMFGGIESTSFKIKWKKLNKRGKQIVRQY